MSINRIQSFVQLFVGHNTRWTFWGVGGSISWGVGATGSIYGGPSPDGSVTVWTGGFTFGAPGGSLNYGGSVTGIVPINVNPYSGYPYSGQPQQTVNIWDPNFDPESTIEYDPYNTIVTVEGGSPGYVDTLYVPVDEQWLYC